MKKVWRLKMTDKEILKKAIEKIERNGFNSSKWMKNNYPLTPNYLCMGTGILSKNNKHYMLIFSHEFAKAYWGEKENINSCYEVGVLKDWEYHLSQMVMKKQPLKYIEDFL